MSSQLHMVDSGAGALRWQTASQLGMPMPWVLTVLRLSPAWLAQCQQLGLAATTDMLAVG